MKLNILKILPILFLVFIFHTTANEALAETKDVGCGNFYSSYAGASNNCTCGSGENSFKYYGRDYVCCGWVLKDGHSDKCFTTSDPEIDPPINITEGLSDDTFDSLNPLKTSGSPVADDLSTPGGIVSRLLNFLFPLAGLALFLLISWGGFEILIGATDQKGMEAGKNRITAAIIGFILLFSSYWMTQIVEVIFGISIL